MRIGGDEWHTVIGVAADVPTFGLSSDWDEILQVYLPFRAHSGSLVLLRLRGDAAGTLPLVRQRVQQIVPEARIELNRAGALLEESVARERFTMRLLLVLAGVALFLASVGLYAVVSQTVGRRVREIGIRIALGARGAQIGWMILRAGALSVGLGLAVGAALAFAGRRVIASQLHDLAPADPTAYAAGAVALALAAFAASWIPTRRAATIDPVRAIASE
jgi:predicted lysophospholipase L1 biosynthesis ABC-type transport system permease subunit